MNEDHHTLTPPPGWDDPPWIVGYNDGYDSYNGVTVQLNPYPPQTEAGRWWQIGYEMARQHDQSEFEEELQNDPH